MKVYLVIETADVEIIRVSARSMRKDADFIFNVIQRENCLHDVEDLSRETKGTVRLAGDDSCAVQLIETDTTAR